MSLEYSVAYPWISGTELLSLDLTRPYYEHLGVGIPDFERLQELARKALSGDSKGTRYQPPENSTGTRLDKYNHMIVPMINSVEQLWGQGGRACLEHWVLYVHQRDNNPWEIYHGLFSQWASRFRRLTEDSIGFAADARTISAQYSSLLYACDTDELEARYVKMALSPWDYSVCHSGAHREYTEFYTRPPFYDSLALTVRRSGFQSFWRWLLSFVGPADLDAIVRALAVDAVSATEQLAAPETRDFWRSVLGNAGPAEKNLVFGLLAAGLADRREWTISPASLPLPPPPAPSLDHDRAG